MEGLKAAKSNFVKKLSLSPILQQSVHPEVEGHDEQKLSEDGPERCEQRFEDRETNLKNPTRKRRHKEPSLARQNCFVSIQIFFRTETVYRRKENYN